MKSYVFAAYMVCMLLAAGCMEREPENVMLQATKVTTLTFYDGRITVTLNKGSSLKYHRPFDNQLWLTGEALIDVDSIESASVGPLEVNVRGMLLYCKQGEFNINAYSMKPQYYAGQYAGLSPGLLTVLSGMVKLAGVELTRCVARADHIGAYRIADLVPEEQVTWVNGYYHFKEIIVPDLIWVLGHLYGIDHVLAGPLIELKDLHILVTDPLSKIIELIDATGYARAEYDEKNRSLVIYGL